MPLYRPPSISRTVANAVHGTPSPRPGVFNESTTPPLEELVKRGVRCESDLVIEPAMLQDTQTGQQVVVTQRIATIEGSREITAILADSGKGSRSLGVVAQTSTDISQASILTEQARSETAGPTTGLVETASPVPQTDPGVGQSAGTQEPAPFYYEGPDTAAYAQYNAQYISLNSSTGGSTTVYDPNGNPIGFNPYGEETAGVIPGFDPNSPDTTEILGGFNADDWQPPGAETLGLTYEELFYYGYLG